jgi:hypothetical protein
MPMVASHFLRAVLVLVTFSSASVCLGEPPGTVRASGRTSTEANKKDMRLREGTKLTTRVGKFQMSGDRVTFSTHQGQTEESFRVLENLMLERVAFLINEIPGERLWEVSGVITEFRGNNYLLLQRVMLLDSENPAP